MSKANNKELEKAKEILNKKVRNYEINKEIGLLEKMTKEGREDAEAAKIVLEELKRLQEENKNLKRANTEKSNKLIEITDLYIKSVPKDEIIEKIEENNKLIEECREDEEHCGEIYLYEHDNKILEELLEGK